MKYDGEQSNFNDTAIIPLTVQVSRSPCCRSLRSRRLQSIHHLLILLIVISICLDSSSLKAQQRTEQDLAEQVARLVPQLSDERFQNRQDAETALLELSEPAIKHLQKFQADNDHEGSLRVQRIIRVIERQVQNNLLDRFLSGKGSLPGWELYCKAVVDPSSQREHYARMFDSHRLQLAELESAQNDTDQSIQLLSDRLNQFTQQQGREQSISANLIALISLQIWTTLEQAERAGRLADLPENDLRSFYMNNQYRLFITEGPWTAIHRASVDRWMTANDERLNSVQFRLMIADRLRLPSGVAAAETYLSPEMSAQRRSPSYVRMAITMLIQFGDESHVATLKHHLENESVIYQNRQTIQTGNSVRRVGSTQIRDMALLGILCLSKKDPREFGFEVSLPEIRNLDLEKPFGLDLGCFESDEKRKESHTKWNELNSKEPSNQTTQNNSEETPSASDKDSDR